MKLGYARGSTEDQNLDIQCARLSEAGCEMKFDEKISGAARGRLELEKLMGHLRKDDFRSEERRGGKGCGSQCTYRCSPFLYKNKIWSFDYLTQYIFSILRFLL